MYKGLIAIDFDGTLALKHDGLSIAKENTQAIRQAHDSGYLIAIVTGRNTRNLSLIMKELGIDGIVDIIVGCNGAEYLDLRKDEEAEIIASIKKDDVAEMLEILEGIDVAVMWNDNKSLFCTPNNPRLPDMRKQKHFPVVVIDRDKIIESFPEEVAKAVLVTFPETGVDVKELIYANKKRDFDIFYTDSNMLEMAAGGINKGTGFHEILVRNNIDAKDTMAIGDHDNDLDMLAESGFAVAMGNAIPEVKAVADYVTSDLEDFGVAEAIQLYLKKKEEIQ